MAFRPSMGGIGGLGGLGGSSSVSGVSQPMNTDALIAHLVEMTPDQRKQFASMHSDDPMMLSAAKYVDNKFKQDAQSLAPKPAGAPPPVNQQAVASMASAPQQMPQQMAQGLPEESGIGALPAPNMQKMAGGGIVAFGDGGDIDGYDKGGSIQNAGSDTTAAYKAYAQTKAAKMGVDPALVDSIFNIESGYDPEAKSPTGPVGIGQLTKATGKAYGVSPEDRTNPYKNIDASVAYMAALQKKYGNDPSKIAVAYNQGEPVLNAHLRANGGDLNPSTLPKEAKGYLKKLNDLLPIASAQAEELPGKTAQLGPDERVVGGMVVDKWGIPIREVGPYTPSPEAQDTRGYAEQAADYMGIPQEFQRNFSNSLNALGGFSSPVSAANRASKVAQGLGATPEMLAEAATAAQKVAAPRLAAPVAEGIATLAPEAQSMRAEAIAVRQARAMAADTQAARGAQQSVDAATKTATMANRVAKGMDSADAAQAAKLNMAEGLVKNATAQNVLNARDRNAAAPGASGIAALTGQDRGAYLPEGLPAYEEEQGPPISAMNKPEAQAAAPEAAAVPAKNPNEWSADDWMALAAGLGQNKSQYFTEALGGGLQNLVANRAANRKYTMEKERSTSQIALEKAQALQAASHQGYYDYLTSGAKEAAAAERAGTNTGAAAQRQALGLIEKHMLNYTNNPMNMMATPAQVAQEREDITRTIMANLSTQGGGTMLSVPAAPALPPGVTVSRVGG